MACNNLIVIAAMLLVTMFLVAGALADDDNWDFTREKSLTSLLTSNNEPSSSLSSQYGMFSNNNYKKY